jgi:hypothetical protein
MLVLSVIVYLIALSVALGKKDAGPVTCGSVVKLVHKETVSLYNYYTVLSS